MTAATRERVYIARVSAKLRAETAAAVEDAAAEAGVKVGEWVRNAICEALIRKANNRTVLAEVVAMRAICLTVCREIFGGGKLTEEFLLQVVEEADARKFALADKRIYEAVQQ